MRAGFRFSLGGAGEDVEVVFFVLVDVDWGGWISKCWFWVMAKEGMALVRAVSRVRFLPQMSLWRGQSDFWHSLVSSNSVGRGE